MLAERLLEQKRVDICSLTTENKKNRDMKNFFIMVIIILIGMTTTESALAQSNTGLGNPNPAGISKHKRNKLLYQLEVKDLSRKVDNQARREDLSFTKLQAGEVLIDPIKGYKGIVANLSIYSRILFRIYSIDNLGKLSEIEGAAFFTSPGERIEYYLLPGDYYCQVFKAGKLIGGWRYNVSPKLNHVLGTQVHWAVWREETY